MKKIGIIFKKEDPLIAGTARQVARELRKEGFRIVGGKPDLVVTLGGDGTILRASRLLAAKKVPILGVHLGGIGFLSELELSELSLAMAAIKRGKYQLDERAMIEVSVGGKKLLALNDVVVTKSGIARVIKFELEGIARYVADGLIFATATGSTAYNLAAGGSLLSPEAKELVISAICPHSLTNRSLVLDRPVTFILNRGEKVMLTVDGQQLVPVKVGEKVVVRRSSLTARFIRLKEYKFFEKIDRIFGFGEGN
jgi:NAD+ kinase